MISGLKRKLKEKDNNIDWLKKERVVLLTELKSQENQNKVLKHKTEYWKKEKRAAEDRRTWELQEKQRVKMRKLKGERLFSCYL